MKTSIKQPHSIAGLVALELLGIAAAVALAAGVVYAYKTYYATNKVITVTNQPFQNIPQQRTPTFLGQ